MNEVSISQHFSGAKALIGAAFIEYFFYSVMYIIEGFKLSEFDDGSASAHKQKSPAKQTHQQQEEQQQNEEQDNNNGKPTDLRDIALEDSKQETENQSQSEGTGETIQPKVPQAVNESTVTEDQDDYEFENMHFLPLFVKNFQKSFVWFMLVLTLACMKGAVGFVIAFAYIQMLFRVLQFIGTIFKKRIMSRIGYVGATVCIVIMFFGFLIDEQHPGTF